MREGPAPKAKVCFLGGTQKKSPAGLGCVVQRQICFGRPRPEVRTKTEAEDRCAAGRRTSPEAVPEQSTAATEAEVRTENTITVSFCAGRDHQLLHTAPGTIGSIVKRA